MTPYKPKIFIGSTIKDMPSERAAALQAVTQVGGIPVMSEFTINAQNSDSVTACLDKVRSSNFYILILGGSYGWQPNGDLSITEMEYLTAQENNIPTLVFNTTHEKEALQEAFSKRVGATYMWKVVSDAFQLKDALVEAIKEEIEKSKTNLREQTDTLYANLLKISFPEYLYLADLNIDRDDIIAKSKETKKWLKKSASWHDVAVSAIHQKGIHFPHDWTIYKKQIITFHDLTEHNLPLAGIIDLGTVTRLRCDEFFNLSDDEKKVFKSLLRSCFKTKLYKLSINWFKDEKLFAFMPVDKDELGRWKNRQVTWQKKNIATRTVVKCKFYKKEPDKLKNIWHLSFAADFYDFQNEWYVSIRPDWIVTYGDFKISRFAFEQIAMIKREEKNIHVFNHLNFILWYLQPNDSESIFDEYKDYPFLKIESFITLETYPRIYDEVWRGLEHKTSKNKLLDKSGVIELFGK